MKSDGDEGENFPHVCPIWSFSCDRLLAVQTPKDITQPNKGSGQRFPFLLPMHSIKSNSTVSRICPIPKSAMSYWEILCMIRGVDQIKIFMIFSWPLTFVGLKSVFIRDGKAPKKLLDGTTTVSSVTEVFWEIKFCLQPSRRAYQPGVKNSLRAFRQIPLSDRLVFTRTHSPTGYRVWRSVVLTLDQSEAGPSTTTSTECVSSSVCVVQSDLCVTNTIFTVFFQQPMQLTTLTVSAKFWSIKI